MNSNPELRSAGVPVQRVARGGQFPPPGGQTVCYRHTQGCGFGSAWIRIHPQKMNADPQLWLHDTVPVFWYLYITRPDKSEAGVTTLPTYRYDNDRDLYRYLVTYTYRWVLGYVYVQMVIT